MDADKLKAEQIKLAKNIILKDALKIEDIKSIAGVYQSFADRKIISAIVVCSYTTMKVLEKANAVAESKIPYISGFRTYREGPAVSEAYFKLSSRPDVMIFYGSGILHPRKIGLASHMGLILDRVSIGITKTPSCGVLKGNKMQLENDIVAELVETRKHSKPLYVSPGYKISLRTSVDIVKSCIKFPHKFPEPLHLAYRYSKDILKDVK